MSAFGDAVNALRTVLSMQDDIRLLKDTATAQSDHISRLAAAHGDLRDRVSRLEGIIEGAAMARGGGGQPRLEGQ